MKKSIAFIFVMVVLMTLLSGSVFAKFQVGPADNSGDGVSDGSGMDNQVNNGDPVVDSPGPAPNSGDGVSDGSGF